MTTPGWNIGIVCYPSFGGSGVMATEIAVGLAERGHQVHLIATAPPVRFRPHERLTFHEVHVAEYPLFQYAPYTLALASTMAEVCRQHHLDLMHVHYAVPHAVSAYLVSQMLGEAAPHTVTTLHGTDVTHVGAEPSYRDLIRMALERCDAITTPSRALRETACQTFGLSDAPAVTVAPNFVDTRVFRPAPSRDRDALSALFPHDPDHPDAPVLIHVSNFRPVKRVSDVVEIFARVVPQRDARLILLGEGPDRAAVRDKVEALGLASRVCFLDNQFEVLSHLQLSDIKVLPSESESFGLAALEALSCGLPVVASRVGGLPELVQDGVTGLLAPVGDVEAMADAVLSLLADPQRLAAFSQAARQDAVQRWDREQALDQYEALFARVLQEASEASEADASPDRSSSSFASQ